MAFSQCNSISHTLRTQKGRNMITYIIGNLFESPAHVLVNTVNTVGVMGKGIAKDFKTIYPEMFKEYQKLCEEKKLTIGKLWLFKTPNKWILNFPTKTTWRLSSKIEYIESGLKTFVKNYVRQGITSISFPPLGCGNGELNWENQVRPLMERYLNKLPIDIFCYLYRRDPSIPEHKNITDIATWLRSEPESLGFTEVWRDLKQIIHSGVNLITLTNQKPFRVEVGFEGEDGICVYTEDRERFIPQEKLMELWSLIRNFGFSMERIMPGGLESFTDHLVTLFSKLPYCRPVKITADYSAFDREGSIGLQWLPQTTLVKKQRESILKVGT